MDPHSGHRMAHHFGRALLHLNYMAGYMPWFNPPLDPGYDSDPEYSGGHSHRTPSGQLTRFVPKVQGRESFPISGMGSSSSLPSRPDPPPAAVTLHTAFELPPSRPATCSIPTVTLYSATDPVPPSAPDSMPPPLRHPPGGELRAESAPTSWHIIPRVTSALVSHRLRIPPRP